MKRTIRGTRAQKSYHAAPAVIPSARTDANILAAARQSAQRSPDRRQLWFVGAMAATVMVSFTARWFIGDPPLTESPTFGLVEGQSHDYLLQFDPLITGPGSQEGMP